MVTAVDPSAVARVLGIKTTFKDLRRGNTLLLPQRVALFGQGSSLAVYSLVKAQVTSSFEVGQTYGFGSPLHLAARQLFPINGDGVGTIPVTVYPLEDNIGGIASAGDITPTVAQTEDASYVVRINNIDSEPFLILTGQSVATTVTAITTAINATLEMPMIAVDGATVVDLTSKWQGTSANDLFIEVIGSTTAGTTFAITQPVGGLVNPNIDDALAQIGDVWETMIVNCLEVSDTPSLDKYELFGEGRWNPLVRRVLMVFTGNGEAFVSNAITISNSRLTDRVNVQLVAPGSNDLPLAIAARELVRVVVTANANPPQDYARQSATGLTPGLDSEQWTYVERQQAILGGSSSIQVRDGVIQLSDTVTFFHPTGDPIPAYRYVVDIVKIQQIHYNLDLIFATQEWDGAPLLPDEDQTSNPSVRKPKAAVAAIATMLDSLALNAIISDPGTAKASITAQISPTNPKRLDIEFTVQLSGNVNIISIDFNFGFFFGEQTVLAA